MCYVKYERYLLAKINLVKLALTSILIFNDITYNSLYEFNQIRADNVNI